MKKIIFTGYIALGICGFCSFFSACKKHPDSKPAAVLPDNYGTITVALLNKCSCADIRITIDGQEKFISKTFATTPDCGAEGTATFQAAPHSTSINFKCNHMNHSTTASFPEKKCNRWLLSFNGKSYF
jgi:hypothetical protein